MCDGCGCDKPATPAEKARRASGNKGGWHVHADGTVHRHDHAHGHSHPYAPAAQPAAASQSTQSKSGTGGATA